MGIDTLTKSTTDTVLGSGIESALQEWIRPRSQELTEMISDLRARVDDLSTSAEEMAVLSASDVAERATAEIAAEADTAAANILSKGKERSQARQYQAVFQLQHNLPRPPQVPDIVNSVILLLLAILIEGIATAAFFLGGGFVAGAGEALVIGLTISGVNTLTSAGIGGFVCGRYWNYGLKCREPDAAMAIKRWTARVGAILTVCAIGGLLIASGIVRATGETDHLSFSLEAIGAAATNFHSLMLWAIGACFAILSWKKGMTAFSDAYPGFSAASKAVSTATEETKLLHHNGLSEIDTVYEEAIEKIAEIGDDINDARAGRREERRALVHEREHLIGKISGLADDFLAFRAEQIGQYEAITGRKPADVNMAPIDTAKLTALLPEIPKDTPNRNSGSADSRKQAVAVLSATRSKSIEAVNTAYQQSLK
ncbi:hypothetical protein SAMN06297129_3763 [Pseudooceanicola antarcticus]|uniref:Uncharacterized protein n=1 Tax=Pseudooceanicola antarcticus TaxID=1247613 RepID=A0A285JH94_9RHOB|nr:hypothetical protein [Pseudooceanicola antarcticus]PJE26418.1 hypothetical protein CVM39_17900 [Pseudooceanicola antarcticus]SNY59443.1 hypothetical protein SAMN06297129_3763 [Pseudooceanicola antarcticus]